MLELVHIFKDYYVDKKPYKALKDINLIFGEKGFVSILGPSGCGKTTLLNLIGGLDQYTSGDLLINNKSTKDFNDKDWDAYRNKYVGFVFQSYNLVPHLSILENVELSMTLTGMKKKERQQKALDMLKKVGLEDIAKKRPNQLSGGQMQRVAIARALVNNPSIILADEPTGALDSATSIQVLDILKEVSKTRLVIMVTHNIELSDIYSDRSIILKDGKIIKDNSAPKKDSTKKPEEIVKAKEKHTHMSFLTALGSSFKSLLTKKGRTVLTAVATSFGIIGVSLVLAMSNGFNNYIANVQMSTASTVPITISPYVTTSIKEATTDNKSYPSETVIKPYDQDLSSLVTIHRNSITQEYSDYCHKLLENPQNYAASVLENHEYLDFNVFTERTTASGSKEVIKVDQFNGAGAGGTILSTVTGLPSTIFHELYGGQEYIESMYDVISGTYPQNKLVEQSDGAYTGEVCLVCDRYNRIPTSTLYNLGLYSEKKISEATTIDFSSLINHEYKTYLTSTIIDAVGGEGSVIEKKLNPFTYCDVTYIDFPYTYKDENGNEQQARLTLPLPIPGTKEKIIKSYPNIAAKKENGSYIYQDKLNELYTNDLVNKPIKLKITGILRPKQDSLVNLMPGSVCYTPCLKNYYVEHLDEMEKYRSIAKDNFYIDTNMMITSTDPIEIMQSNWMKFYMLLLETIVSGNSSTLTTNYLNNDEFFHFYGLFSDAENPDSDPDKLIPSFTAYTRSNYRVGSEFKMVEFSDSILYNGIKIPVKFDPTLIDGFYDLISYATGYSNITSLLVFPKTLNDKQKIFNYLDAWNKNLAEDKQILYSDIAGSVTDAVGTMIDIISIVLICFSAISLLVSCVMTGIITYTSVLERTKEIGILRAIGARKKDVGRLFEAESVIIGALAGIVGCVFTFIVEAPISIGINAAIPAEQNVGMICNLHPLHALVLVCISILLTFISGFIPARKAAKKDPVVALRTE